MGREEYPPILSASHRHLWRLVEPSIWKNSANRLPRDLALSLLRTLLDQPRWMEAYHLYDERGSQLFERICELPEYYLTRTENAILAKHARGMIGLAPVECIVELGAGFSKKTIHLLHEQVRQRQGGTFAAIDVSPTGLVASRDAARSLFPQIQFVGMQALFEEGIASIEKSLPTLFVFLGSTIGNFTPPEFGRFFQNLAGSMGREDFFLLGVDRVKAPEVLERAYNDSQGITADFILNAFRNVNGLLGSNFDPHKMHYEAHYHRERQQVEMLAVSASDQEIVFPPFGTSFLWEEGEKILVEISRKFDSDRLQKQLRCFGIETVKEFTDREQRFSLILFKRSPDSNP